MEVILVANYRKMYDSLFNDVTDAISLLQRAQQKTEEMFVSSSDGDVYEFEKGKPESEPNGDKK